jgi:peptidoglycan L-alanyl-D-glutamate endopeptidase CwlK
MISELLDNFKTQFVLGSISKKRLASCHPDLIKIVETAIKITNVDFGISEGHRSIELQQKYYQEGKSLIDGITKKGKHNYSPSLAIDYYPWVNGEISWSVESLSYLAGIFHAVAEMLFAAGEITHKLRWGGNWDMDGEILTDQTLDDRPHMELVNP